MSEIINALELKPQFPGDGEPAAPLVDMRSARLLSETPDSTDLSHLPLAKVTADYLELGDTDEKNNVTDATYALDTNSEEGLNIRGLLTQLLEYPGAGAGIVPDTWGAGERSAFRHVSPAMDSVYALDSGLKNFIDHLKGDIKDLRSVQKA